MSKSDDKIEGKSKLLVVDTRDPKAVEKMMEEMRDLRLKISQMLIDTPLDDAFFAISVHTEELDDAKAGRQHGQATMTKIEGQGSHLAMASAILALLAGLSEVTEEGAKNDPKFTSMAERIKVVYAIVSQLLMAAMGRDEALDFMHGQHKGTLH